jgi:peptidoglycan/xylan/chitin deacetylase (PgdA/CDA1 family)
LALARFIVSLDFELHWGRFDKYELEPNLPYYHNTVRTIPAILSLFAEKDIHATWAAVGMLMAENREEWEEYLPAQVPEFRQGEFSAIHWYRKNNTKETLGLFAPELIQRILGTPNQELGSHTHSHYYTGVAGAENHSFRADLMASRRIAREKFGTELRSLVFPRNQYDHHSLATASECGFEVARTNPTDWFWEDTVDESLLKRIFRTGDTLFPIGTKTSFKLNSVNTEGIVKLPASRILRPYKQGSIFNERRIARIKSEINRACALGEVYHLWWHPHNFGHSPEENMKVLENLLNFVREKIDSGQMISQTMYECAGIDDRKQQGVNSGFIKI